MANSTWIMILLLILSVGLLVNNLIQHRQHKKQWQKGLDLFCYVQRVIELIQQHRGLANARYVSGEGFESQLGEIQQQLAQLLRQQAGQELARFEAWQSFSDHWPKLRESTNLTRLTAVQSMRQHSALIESQFYLMDDLAQHYGLYKIKLDDMSHMYSLCVDTLRTAETIAKARGVGTGLCGYYDNLAADAIALRFIKRDLSLSSEQLSSELMAVKNQSLLSYFKQS